VLSFPPFVGFFSSQGETIKGSPVLPHLPSTSWLNLFFFLALKFSPKIFILSQILCLERKSFKEFRSENSSQMDTSFKFWGSFSQVSFFFPLNLIVFQKHKNLQIHFFLKTGPGFFSKYLKKLSKLVLKKLVMNGQL
jgi:hypothetical protein